MAAHHRARVAGCTALVDEAQPAPAWIAKATIRAGMPPSLFHPGKCGHRDAFAVFTISPIPLISGARHTAVGEQAGWCAAMADPAEPPAALTRLAGPETRSAVSDFRTISSSVSQVTKETEGKQTRQAARPAATARLWSDRWLPAQWG